MRKATDDEVKRLFEIRKELKEMCHLSWCKKKLECPKRHLCSLRLSMKTAVWWSISEIVSNILIHHDNLEGRTRLTQLENILHSFKSTMLYHQKENEKPIELINEVMRIVNNMLAD